MPAPTRRSAANRPLPLTGLDRADPHGSAGVEAEIALLRALISGASHRPPVACRLIDTLLRAVRLQHQLAGRAEPLQDALDQALRDLDAELDAELEAGS